MLEAAYEMHIIGWSADVCSSDLAVDAARRSAGVETGPARQDAEDALLQRVLIGHIARGRHAEVAQERQKAAVLARAVVVGRRCRAAPGQQRDQRRLVGR